MRRHLQPWLRWLLPCPLVRPGNSGAVYEIDMHNARASLQPRRFPRTVTDLAFDPKNRRLLATVESVHLLLAMAPNGQVSDLGPTHSETGLGGWPISAVACVTLATGLFGDDFESGDVSFWAEGLAPASEAGEGSR